MEHVRPGRDSLRVLITNEMVYFLGKSSDSEKDNIMLLVVYDELYHCRTIGKGKPSCSHHIISLKNIPFMTTRHA